MNNKAIACWKHGFFLITKVKQWQKKNWCLRDVGMAKNVGDTLDRQKNQYINFKRNKTKPKTFVDSILPYFKVFWTHFPSRQYGASSHPRPSRGKERQRTFPYPLDGSGIKTDWFGSGRGCATSQWQIYLEGDRTADYCQCRNQSARFRRSASAIATTHRSRCWTKKKKKTKWV